MSWIEPLLTIGRFLKELWWPWTRSCRFALSKENCFWWRNNQNICLFKWMVLRACTERHSPSLRLWGYSEPPINQHAGTESSVLEEMHSDLAYAYSGGITRGNIGAQIVSGVWLKALHSACKCYSTEGTVQTARCYTKCSFLASLTRLLLLFFAGDWMKSSWSLHACSIIAHPVTSPCEHISLESLSRSKEELTTMCFQRGLPEPCVCHWLQFSGLFAASPIWNMKMGLK